MLFWFYRFSRLPPRKKFTIELAIPHFFRDRLIKRLIKRIQLNIVCIARMSNAQAIIFYLGK